MPHNRQLVEYDQLATRDVACPVCHAGPGHQCSVPRRRAVRMTHKQRVRAHLQLINKRPVPPGS